MESSGIVSQSFQSTEHHPNVRLEHVLWDRTWMDKSRELPLYFCVLEWSFLWRMQSLAIILKGILRSPTYLCQMIDLSHFIRVIPRALFFLWWIFCTEWSPTFSLVLWNISVHRKSLQQCHKMSTVQKILIYNITLKNCNCLPDTSNGSKKHQHLFTWHKLCFCTLPVSHFGKTNKSKE